MNKKAKLLCKEGGVAAGPKCGIKGPSAKRCLLCCFALPSPPRATGREEKGACIYNVHNEGEGVSNSKDDF